jgi:hypothetical protein
MSGRSGHVVQWDAGRGGGGSDCEQAGPLPAAVGVIPTLVIATTGDICYGNDRNREYKGVVFYNSEPVAWWCLAADELVGFRTWAATAFPSVQIVTVSDPATVIACPPSPSAQEVPNAALIEQTRQILRARAPQWFVPAIPTGVTQLVA